MCLTAKSGQIAADTPYSPRLHNKHEQNAMKRTSRLLAATAVLSLVLAPGLAYARAGGSSSMGSRGSQTYSAPPSTNTSPGFAQPMQRSMTPQSAPAPSMAGAGATAPRRSGFGSGLAGGLLGGLIGVGLGGMLMGHGFFGGGMGILGFLGLVLQIVLAVVIVRFLYRMFMGNRRPAMAGGPNILARGNMAEGPGPMGGGGGGAPSGPPRITITPGDYQQFEQLLQRIQAAWSTHDLNSLRAMATPEMLSYFAEQLGDQASRGVRNLVTDVKLQSGDLSEAWAEQGREYATVAMRFSMIDVTQDASGRVVDGSPTEHVTATEIWTFVRSRGGNWILSAIQQTR